jgi:hypothetical protein
MRIPLSAIAALGLSFVPLAAPSPAAAWGCFAHGEGSAQGWSFGYKTKGEAKTWALKSCRARPHSGSCHVTRCDPNATNDAFWGQ